MKQMKCKVCGCTDDDCRQCIEKTGHPCHWIKKDLCSACNDLKITKQINMKLYIAINGDMSSKIILFAENRKEARKICKARIKKDELEDRFPVLSLTEYPVTTGIVEITEDVSEY